MEIFNNKKFRIITSAILAIIVYFVLIQPILEGIKYRHKVVKNAYERYFWLLNDSVKLDNTWGHDKFLSVTGMVRESDQYFSYNLEGGIYVHVLEFKDLNQLRINDVNFNFQGDFSSFKNRKIGILNEDLEGWPVITMKFKLPFHNSLSVNFNPGAKLNAIKDNPDCKAFYGSLNKMSLSNAVNEHLVLFDFSTTPKALITFYTAKSRFFVIIISSGHPLDESCIDLLNLQ